MKTLPVVRAGPTGPRVERPMAAPPVPSNEEQRLRALVACDILDTPHEKAYDDLAQLAAQMCDAPIALVTLVDKSRQWFKAAVNLDARETPRDVAFCAYTILQGDPLVVEDATADARFVNNPFVTGAPHVRFYAGTPLCPACTGGVALGTLCVIDHVPRRLTGAQRQALLTLGRAVESLLDLRLRVHQLARREAELQAQRDELARAHGQKEELVSFIVHDLRSPLAATVANARFLLEESHAPEVVLDCAGDIASAGEAMLGMLCDLVDVGRSEDGTFALDVASFDARELAREVVNGAVRPARERGHSIALDVPNAPVVVAADRAILRRVLSNLVDNSLKYMGRPGEVRIEVALEAHAVEFRVRDVGPGIPPEHRERIFAKFARLDRDVTAHAGASSGLGLAFCRLAVLAHGGRLWVEDNAPRGSVFRLRLPRE